jgi:hypothetical protein
MKVEGFREPITRKGADLLYLPESSNSKTGETSLGVATNGQGANQ